MAHKRSALKAHRVAERKRLRNRSVRSALRTYVRKARLGIASGEAEGGTAAVQLAAKQLDAAASKGIIHPNQAARRKSRLMRQLAAQQRTVAPAAPDPAPARPARRSRASGTRSRAS